MPGCTLWATRCILEPTTVSIMSDNEGLPAGGLAHAASSSCCNAERGGGGGLQEASHADVNSMRYTHGTRERLLESLRG